MRERFDDPRSKQKFLHQSTLKVIEQANAIVAEYQAQGYVLSLRQLYYKFVSRNFIKNSDNSYKRLSDILTTGRIQGLIDWDALEDRVRYWRIFGREVSPEHFSAHIWQRYHEDIWADQENFCAFVLEKDAITGIMEKVCGRWRAPYFACRGFNSSTEMYNMAKRIEDEREKGKNVYIFHIGDHDPSGIDMTRDNEARLRMFLRDPSFTMHRIALNMDQVRRYNPPPQPNKTKDNREPAYRAVYGVHSWEVDALEPSVLDEIVTQAVENILDRELFDAALERERIARERLEIVGKYFSRAEELLNTEQFI